MQKRYLDRYRYFKEQEYTTAKYVMPFVSEVMNINEGTSVLEIGCGEGGNLKPFLDMGCKVTGIDIDKIQIQNAEKFFERHEKRENLKLFAADIYAVDDPALKFDLVMMRDVVEHIRDQEKFMNFVKKFFKAGGKLFIGFPPWQNPFGGHQQSCNSQVLQRTPFIHLLPPAMYKGLMKLFGESDETVAAMMEIRSTGITIERFRKILADENYSVDREIFYFINPNYEIKYRLKPVRQSRIIASIPYVRDFLTTTFYCVVSPENSGSNL